MGNLLRSRDDMISLAQTYGAWRFFYVNKVGATTAATTNSGKVNVKRFQNVAVPSLGAGVTAAYLTYGKITTPTAGAIAIAGHETNLGTLTVSGNSFSAGSAMPTMTIEGASTTTASLLPILAVTTAMTATTPVLTITYTDQDGNTGQTCSMTLPTNCTINSAYLMTPHLANGDTGVRAVTNMSISTGSAGVVSVFGVLPQIFQLNSGAASGNSISAVTSPYPMVPFSGGDSLGIYIFGVTTAIDIYGTFCFLPDN